MDSKFLDNLIEADNVDLPASEHINPFLLKNNTQEIRKALRFLSSSDKFFYVHGFLGTGKRQFVNYVLDFCNKDVIKLEYYCKESTVCDDILLNFIEKVEKIYQPKTTTLNAKITTLNVKFQQYVSSLKKPVIIILHSFDDVQEENRKLIQNCIKTVLELGDVKLIISSRALNPDILGDTKFDSKAFLKGFSKDLFKEFLDYHKISYTETVLEDFYKYTRGYYYYTILTVKIIQAMNLSLSEFLQKFSLSGMNYDSYLGATYISVIPTAIRNFFWFLRSMRHGLTLNALAVLELYDSFAVEYLKTNLMIFESDETIYVQDYFQQNIDISIPDKTEIKLHKYIVSIYEKQLKEPLPSRVILLSRQAMRAEIDYHNKRIKEIKENGGNIVPQEEQVNIPEQPAIAEKTEQPTVSANIEELFKKAKEETVNKNYTEALETYQKVLDSESVDLRSVIDARLKIARIYKTIEDYSKSSYYYELVKMFYEQHKEVINLNYLLYEMTELYFKMYKNDRAIETIKQVIYSVDTPASLMLSSCILLGNIYSVTGKNDEAYTYYKKAIECIDENTLPEELAELYFKYALINDDKENLEEAFEYYSKCVSIIDNNPYRASAYSNLASCYYENGNYSDARDCYQKAYDIEKSNNNFDGIYYTALSLAKIFADTKEMDALNYLLEAKQCAEFINEDFYILESTIALGDYYYNNPQYAKRALSEYFQALNVAQRMSGTIETSTIQKRINDMKLRVDAETYKSIEEKYSG